MGRSRQPEHQALIDWLLGQVEEHAVDAVVIAGDIFDTGTPPSYARELYSQLVVRLYEAGVALLILGGNHDSAATLGESRALLAQLGAAVVPSAENPAEQLRILPRRDGAPGCIVCAVPYIRPRDVLQSQAGQSAEDKQQSLLAAIRAHYRHLHDAALARRQEFEAELGRTLPILATGHLTTVGASTGESVREIYVGSLEALPANAFPPADYIALGHIHRPQLVGGQTQIRYSGSPIPLAFDEAKQQKEMLLVEFADDRPVSVTPLAVPRFQALRSLAGNLGELANAIAAAAAEGTRERPAWLEVTVAEDDYLADLPARVEALAEGWPVEVLRIRRQRGNATAHLAPEACETLDELTPAEVFARRLAQEVLPEELANTLTERYQRIISSLDEAEA